MNHIMLDLETLSARNNAYILAIGAVRFDLDNFWVAPRGGAEFYKNITIPERLLPSFHIDPETVRWWMRQDDEARSIFYQPAEEITTALHNFRRFAAGTNPKDTIIWGNGATFDNVILRNAYEACSMIYPVTYKNDLCYRTLLRMFNHILPDTYFVSTMHNALDDARNQAQKLVDTFKALKDRTIMAR
jgi:3' exoribonuclease, RNase T-like